MKKLLTLTALAFALSACSTTSTVDFGQKEKSYHSYTIRDLSFVIFLKIISHPKHAHFLSNT